MKFNVLLALTLLILISSCAKTPGKTDAKFKLKISSLTDLGSAGAGGAMLWGKSDKGDMFGVNITTSSDLNLELANGSWSFWSVAWEGKNNIFNFEGLTRCAKSTSVFNGADAQININLSNATCADTDFSPAVSTQSGVIEFPLISRRECDKLSDHNGFNCGSGIGSNAKSASRRLLMPSFKKIAGGSIELTGSALVSVCHVGNSHEMTDTHLPLGNGVIPAFTILQSFFTSTACDETDPKGFVKDNFEMGLKATINPNATIFVNNGLCNGANFSESSCTIFGGIYSAGVCSGLTTASMSDISETMCVANGGTYSTSANKRIRVITAIPENIFCSGKRIDPNITIPTIFASGNGLPQNPFRICKEYQLNSIGAAYAGNMFALNADLDMNATSIFGDQPMAACLNSKPGANFIPIGGMFDSSCNEVTEANFGSGIFNGKNHTISNIRLHSKLSNIGFIRSGGSVFNLTLNNMEVDGLSYVGAFSGSTTGSLSNLMLLRSRIRGNDKVGGIVGGYSPTALNLKSSHVKKSSIEIDGTTGYGGGLIGETIDMTSALTIDKSSFEGVINAQGSGAVVGGLVGAGAIAPVIINESYSSGAMIVHGSDFAGGLIGAAGVGFTVSNSYSRMNIGPATNDIGEGGYIGGLVGQWALSGQFTNSFFHGSIMHPCAQKGTPCSIGGLSGNPSAVMNTAYAAFVSQSWFDGAAVPQASELATIESASIKNNLIQSNTPALFKDVGASFVRLAWESGVCAIPGNNLSVATQSSFKGSLANPIVICNKEQWREIKNYPTLNYIIADNIGVGEITSSDTITTLSGTINGDGNVVGGIYNMAVNTPGIIASNYGKISNIVFASSYMKVVNNTTLGAGIVGNNMSSGEIFDNKFLSVNIKNSMADFTGVIAGINSGKIYRNKVSSISSVTKSAGLVVGDNRNSGILTGNRVEGSLSLLSSTDSFYFGLVAAESSGKISETDVNGTLINSSTGNTGPGSFIGAFLGENSGAVSDILIRPATKLVIAANGPLYGQVFGQVTTAATVKNVLALNETPVSLSMTGANVKSFVGYADGGAIYKNSYQLAGNVFRLSSTPVIFDGCSQSGSVFTYELNAPLVLTSPYTDGFYLPSANGGQLSARITANVTNGVSSFTSDFENGNFVLPCTASGITAGTTTFYPYKNEPDFSHTEVHSITLRDLKKFEHFCPSSSAVPSASKMTAFCDTGSGEFNMVEDVGVGMFGYQRLYNAHKLWLQTGSPPDVRPVWVMSNEGYPKLFIAD